MPSARALSLPIAQLEGEEGWGDLREPGVRVLSLLSLSPDSHLNQMENPGAVVPDEPEAPHTSNDNNKNNNENRTIEERYGILAWPIKCYYRYTVMTGIYMLGAAETGFLHFFYVLGAYFLYKYVWSFLRDMEFFFGSKK